MLYWISGKYVLLTNEFMELMKKEGFIYEGRQADGRKRDIFINRAKQLQVGIRIVQYQGEPHPIAEIMITPLTDTGTTPNSTFDLKAVPTRVEKRH